MGNIKYDRTVALLLFVALAVSFILCMVSDLRLSAALNQSGLELAATAGMVGLGYSWLIGHGLHGAAVVAVPLFFLARPISSLPLSGLPDA
jgi:hypothetical protein